MAKVFAVINQKGGVGKSTTATTMAAGLVEKGFRVLVVDMDAQANTSYVANAQTKGLPAINSVLTGEVKASQAIQPLPCFHIIPANGALVGADNVFVETGKEFKLKEALEEVQGNYDYIVIDTPPTLGILVVNALTACNSVIIPAQADIFSLQGIAQLSKTIWGVKKYCNPTMTIEGILLTRYSQRAVLSREIAAHASKIASEMNTKVFNTTIREAVAVKEAQVNRKTLFEYVPKDNVTEDYRAFIEEVIGA